MGIPYSGKSGWVGVCVCSCWPINAAIPTCAWEWEWSVGHAVAWWNWLALAPQGHLLVHITSQCCAQWCPEGAWKQLWCDYFHHRNQQLLQIGAFLIPTRKPISKRLLDSTGHRKPWHIPAIIVDHLLLYAKDITCVSYLILTLILKKGQNTYCFPW